MTTAYSDCSEDEEEISYDLYSFKSMVDLLVLLMSVKNINSKYIFKTCTLKIIIASIGFIGFYGLFAKMK